MLVACCAAQPAEAVETPPVDADAEPHVKAPSSSGLTKTLLTQVEIAEKKGFVADSRNPFQDSFGGLAAPRFDRYQPHLTPPAWGEEERQKPWTTQNGRGRNAGNMLSSMEAGLPAEFRPVLSAGICVDAVDVPTQLFCQSLCRIDLAAGTLHLMSAFMPEEVFYLAGMVIFKGAEFSCKLPGLAHVSSNCIGLEFDDQQVDGETICLHFDGQDAREAFFEVLRMAQSSEGAAGGSRSLPRKSAAKDSPDASKTSRAYAADGSYPVDQSWAVDASASVTPTSANQMTQKNSSSSGQLLRAKSTMSIGPRRGSFR